MYKLTKRLFDILSSSIALVLLSPLLLPIIVLLRLTSEGEVFYFQQRIGMYNKPFKIFKFATMLKNSSKMKGGYITVKNDHRLTLMGGILRKSKINELLDNEIKRVAIIKKDQIILGEIFSRLDLPFQELQISEYDLLRDKKYGNISEIIKTNWSGQSSTWGTLYDSNTGVKTGVK